MIAQNDEVLLHVRKQLAGEAGQIFQKLGMNVEEAVQAFLRKTVEEKHPPFDMETPNRETLETFREIDRNIGIEPFSMEELERNRA